MATMVVERTAARERTRVASLISYVGGAAFLIAAVWYGLATKGITMAKQPNPGPAVPVAQAQKMFQAWLVTTLQQERLYTGIAILGFLCMAAVAVFLSRTIGRSQPLARAAAMAMVLGVALWIGGNVAHMGAYRAVGLLSTHDYSPEIVSAVQFTVDLVENALEVAAFAIIGAGLLAFATVSDGSEPANKNWRRLTVVLGLAAIATAISRLGDSGDLTDLMLITTGAVLVPAWMIWSGRRLAEPDMR